MRRKEDDQRWLWDIDGPEWVKHHPNYDLWFQSPNAQGGLRYGRGLDDVS